LESRRGEEIRLNEQRVLTYPIPFSMRKRLSLGFKKLGNNKEHSRSKSS
jgi:hypothetical protein